MQPVIRAQGITKSYRIFDRPGDRLLRRPPRLLHALHGVTLALPAGGRLGVVGDNGSGKSTLLRILAGVTSPSAGRVQVEGPVGAILDLGAGFHPDFTGRQNLRLTAALMGLSPDAMEARTEEIVAFSELHEFIDQPVRRYSTGMVMRLGFAVATQGAPSVLIVDEALAVGDGRFQKKCIDRIRQLVDDGTALVLCSHSLYYVATLCETALWLDRGRVRYHDRAADVVREYERDLQRRERSDVTPMPKGSSRGPHIERVDIIPATWSPALSATGSALRVEVHWSGAQESDRLQLAVGLDTVSGVQVLACATHRDGMQAVAGRECGQGRLTIDPLPLVGGEYDVHVYLLDESGLHVHDHRVLPSGFAVSTPEYNVGLIAPMHHWDWPLD